MLFRRFRWKKWIVLIKWNDVLNLIVLIDFKALRLHPCVSKPSRVDRTIHLNLEAGTRVWRWSRSTLGGWDDSGSTGAWAASWKLLEGLSEESPVGSVSLSDCSCIQCLRRGVYAAWCPRGQEVGRSCDICVSGQVQDFPAFHVSNYLPVRHL